MQVPCLKRFLTVAAAFTIPWVFAPPAAWAQTIVAMVQLQSSDAGNFDKMKSLAQQAKAQGAQLVIFPEASDFGWLNPAVFTQAAPIPGTYSDKFAAIATSVNIWVAAGLSERARKQDRVRSLMPTKPMTPAF
jgi:predicted amidohydrolase